MEKKRILYHSDGTVTILTHASKSPLSWKQSMDKSTPPGTSYDDVDVSEIPVTRDKRHTWTGSKGKGINVDNTIKSPREKIEEKRDSAHAKLKALGLTQAELDVL